MTTTGHKNITGNQLHVDKGADTAAVDKVYVADGAGSGTWQKLTASSLATSAKPFSSQLLHVQEEAAAGASSADTVGTTFAKRTLTTVKTNEISGASLASSQITLPAGTFWIEARAPAYSCNFHQARFKNVTDGTVTISGTSEYLRASPAFTGDSWCIGRFTISGSKVFELQHVVSASAVGDGGYAAGVNTGEVTVWTQVFIWKIA